MYLFQPDEIEESEPDKNNLHSTMYLFQPTSVARCFFRFFNLHSTMYLFQLDYRSRSDLQNYDIYIPLCIYFN